jgi:hypothetical protein
MTKKIEHVELKEQDEYKMYWIDDILLRISQYIFIFLMGFFWAKEDMVYFAISNFGLVSAIVFYAYAKNDKNRFKIFEVRTKR